MTTHVQEIKNLLTVPCQKGPDVTTALKKIGDNESMQRGLNRIAVFFHRCGKEQGKTKGIAQGRIQGCIGTVCVGAIIFGVKYAFDSLREKKALEKERAAIHAAFSESLLCDNTTNVTFTETDIAIVNASPCLQ